MSTKEALKEFQDYFTEIEWSEHAVKKVENLLDKLAQANHKVVVKHKYIKIVHGAHGLKNKLPELVDFEALAQKVCAAHNLPEDALYSKNRKREYVSARADFIWRVKRQNPTQSLKSIGRYLRRDHTTIMHLLNGITYGHYPVGVGEEKE